MKTVNYFGKECEVSNDVRWVATNWRGTVLAFCYEPTSTDCGWAGGAYDALDRLPVGNAYWKNSLRQVKDIIVKENELKVGDKVELLRDRYGFKKGQIVELYKLSVDGVHLFKGANARFRNGDDEQSAYLAPSNYVVIGKIKPHPHADLMLKYAMIAQYDDKPWESFEYYNSNSWVECSPIMPFNETVKYRLKPQEPKIQIGQIWVSREGFDVMVDTPSDAKTIYFSFNVFGCHYKNFAPIGEFLQNFKRKE